MSKIKVGFVTEGPTDKPVLEQIVKTIYPDYSIEIQSFFPEKTSAIQTRGWGGVKVWCEEFRKLLNSLMSFNNIDILIILVDQDIAVQLFNNCKNENPNSFGAQNFPTANTPVNIGIWIRKIIEKDWLDNPQISDCCLVYCTPAQAIETWIWASIMLDVHVFFDSTIERIKKPEKFLPLKKYKSGKKEGQPKKTRKQFEELSKNIPRDWRLIRILSQAGAFSKTLEDCKV